VKERRALIRFDDGGFATYEVGADMGEGARVSCSWGNFSPSTRFGTVAAIYSDGRMEHCVCGTAILRLEDGHIEPAYFGACKRAYPR
jgi:hypothetical protein